MRTPIACYLVLLTASIARAQDSNRVGSFSQNSTITKVEVVDGDTLVTRHINNLGDKATLEKKESAMFMSYVDEQPSPKYRVNKFLSEAIRYPRKARKDKIEGRVIVKFVVNTSGTITNPEIISSPSDLLSAEALRVVKSMPPWQPGKHDGKPVKVFYTLPINFKL
jgi:TonB family protein